MPLEQAGPSADAARRQTDLNAWMRLLPPRAGVAAHGPTPVPIPAPVTSYKAPTAALPSRAPAPASAGSKGNYKDDQDEISQQLKADQQQRSSSSILPHARNGLGKIHSRSASPAHHGPRHSPSRPFGGAPDPPSKTTSRHSQALPSRLQQATATKSSAMDIDELANSDGDDETDLLPLVMSDLDPQFREAAATPKKPPTPPAAKPAKPTQPAQSSNLSIRHPTTPHKTNGTHNVSTAPAPQPVVTIPLASYTPTAHRPHSSTPKKEAPMTVSVSLPALYTPKRHSTDHTHVSRPPGSPENVSASAKPKSPVVNVGRRSIKGADIRIKGGRPKGWKPGMTYREVALRNLGVDPNDPSLPPEILLPPRPKKHGRPPGRPPGRPRLPGRPKVKPSQSLGFKRIGRPPIQSIDTVQRSIFLNGQAHFAPFMCEWAGCQAELQNMATLRKHVAVVHGRPSSAAKTCQWRTCAGRVPCVQYKDNTDTDVDGRTFLEHMDYQHLAPLSWHRGDGFANNGHIGPPELPPAAALLTKERSRDEAKSSTENGATYPATIPASLMYAGASSATAPEMSLDGIPREDLPRYLLDDKGKQVTPLLRDTVLESSSMFWTQEERGRRLKELYRMQQQHLNKRPDRSLSRMI